MSFPSSFLAHSVDHHSNSSSSEAFLGGSADLWIDAGVVALVRLYVRVKYRAATAILKIITHSNIANIRAVRALAGAGRQGI